MKKYSKLSILLLCITLMMCALTGCESASVTDREVTKKIGDKLAENQPTPTDIEYSLERYNLIRREYWINGMEEKAKALECPVQKPLGYVVLMLEGVGVVDTYVVDGKISSLNSYLTPDSEYYGSNTVNKWLPDIDGTYGNNDGGIFFFTVDGHYKEWNGHYLYSDTPMHIDECIIKVEEID